MVFFIIFTESVVGTRKYYQNQLGKKDTKKINSGVIHLLCHSSFFNSVLRNELYDKVDKKLIEKRIRNPALDIRGDLNIEKLFFSEEESIEIVNDRERSEKVLDNFCNVTSFNLKTLVSESEKKYGTGHKYSHLNKKKVDKKETKFQRELENARLQGQGQMQQMFCEIQSSNNPQETVENLKASMKDLERLTRFPPALFCGENKPNICQSKSEFLRHFEKKVYKDEWKNTTNFYSIRALSPHSVWDEDEYWKKVSLHQNFDYQQDYKSFLNVNTTGVHIHSDAPILLSFVSDKLPKKNCPQPHYLQYKGKYSFSIESFQFFAFKFG